jgi:hypothetical protein
MDISGNILPTMVDSPLTGQAESGSRVVFALGENHHGPSNANAGVLMGGAIGSNTIIGLLILSSELKIMKLAEC